MKRWLLLLLVLLAWTATSEGQYYFGRNKVQYNHFEWQIFKTRHFDIYFYPEMRELAEIGATFAEEAYSRLENLTNYSFNHPIPLIFYSNHFHFQQTNTIPNLIPEGVGGFFEFLKGRVVIPATGSLSEFEHVINHELVHVFTHGRANRILKDHKRTQHAGLPLWFTEGIAEYWSEGWDSEAEMFIRDAVLAGQLVPLSQMYRIYGTFLMYKEGQAICKFIAERYGEQKLLQLIENIWKADNFSEVMKLTLGVDYREFDKLWLYHLKKEKYPLLEDHDVPGMITRHLTDKGISTKPAFACYGEQREIVFLSNRVGYSNIYRMPYGMERAEKGHPETLVDGERTTEFEAFNLLRSKLDVNRHGLLAFVSKSRGYDALYIYSLSRKKIVSRHQFDELVTLSSPSWSPDGRRLAFAATGFAGMRDLFLLDLDSERLTKLTNDHYDDRDPAWSPDGRVLAFASDRTVYGRQGAYNLFFYHLGSGEIEYVTYGKHRDYAPAWSADGRALAFTSDRDGAFNLWMLQVPGNEMQVATTASLDNPFKNGDAVSAPLYPRAINGAAEMRKLTSFTTGAFDPEWTDKGSLLFTAFERFNFQIRELENVQEVFEQATVRAVDTLHVRRPPWTIAKLSGEMSPTQFSYKRKFSLDIAQSQITQDPIFGAAGGAQLAMSDMLGNEQYHFLVFNNAQTRSEFLESFNVAVSRFDLSRRANHAFGLYHFAGRYYNYAEGYFFERRYGGFGALSYPLSVFERVEASVNVRQSHKHWEGLSLARDALLVSNFVSFVKDNSLWGPSGPVDGRRFNFALGYTVDVRHSKVNFYTILADYRHYFRLGVRNAYALRLQTQYNQGKEAYPFFMGGSWDLRLYPRWRIWGQKTFLLSQELRFPFIDGFVVAFPFGGVGFSSIRGALFVDLGNAWDQKLERLLGSTGFGVRLRVGGFLVLRYDIGRRFYWNDLDRGLAPGRLQLDRKVYQQFFFGWDF
ncbi:MAG: BamA/TamA family outer membrane protein [candidate division KSB1 bacterium]|nr:BamA/TamA family outer membrane protein [candidate division KSB1 bacterium]MDZ7273856.1 BamA/TamA family outer membrane protein [candidate division KSB1 bacterium]MDZ7286012.1 BamA/TamA family outer membrane protein [candidate division KSB1 bacterium]MDZ7299044.1 BamA/TamA family outer membrane protein [candidate division KSB1 bacterium]MDZ7308810.1 BamA/TamA family outer membrane protein [candidate division KSB1 bacterium]